MRVPFFPRRSVPVLALTLFVLSSTALAAPGEAARARSYRFLTDSGVASFPFDVFRGDIRFQGKINGHDVHLLLDDGFMWDELLLWGGPRVDALGLKTDGQVSVSGSDDDAGIASSLASGITLTLPGIEFTDQAAVITPAGSGTGTMWSGSEGQVSGTFLKNLVVDINFDRMVITLIDSARFDYTGNGVAIPWTPLGSGPRGIPGKLRLDGDRSVALTFAMDLGYNDQLLINTNRGHEIKVPERRLSKSLGFNIQGEETLGYVGRVGRVEIGGFKVKDVVAAFVPEEHWNDTFDEVMIGLGLLSRFNLVFDYSRERLFIEPNGSFKEPFETDMSGLSLGRSRGDYLEVRRVEPGSPAGEAGLKVGDRVIRINGRAATEYDIWSLRPLLQREGAKVKLSIAGDEGERSVVITLRRLI